MSSLRSIISGAAPLGSEIQDEVSQRLKVFVRQAYGMTELSPVSHMQLDDPKTFDPGMWSFLTEFHRISPLLIFLFFGAGSIGYLVSGMEAKIVDPVTGKELGYDEEGELWLRGPNVMKGYLNRPDATAETIDKDGFLHTGDIAVVRKNNNYFITDRLKELIKVKGLQVAPAELEAVLLVHPAVADAAVIGIPDERAGEVIFSFIIILHFHLKC